MESAERHFGRLWKAARARSAQMPIGPGPQTMTPADQSNCSFVSSSCPDFRTRGRRALSLLALLGGAISSFAQVAPAPTKADAPASDEILHLDAVVTTGSVTPRSKLESALAVTTLDPGQMQQIAPRSVAEMLKAVPGLYLESTGGEVGNNLVARGVATNGGVSGTLYVALQEDGLPILSESNFRFTQADTFLRATNFVERVEALRGGSAGVFASSDPLGIINFITREGTQEVHGEVKLQTGDYGLFRNEAWIAGPINNNTTFALGGFYRLSDGIRKPGYTADKGGQLMGNVKYNFPNRLGYVKVLAKVMNDHPAFEMPFPLQNRLPVAINSEVGVTTIPGGPDMNSAAVTSVDTRFFSFPGSPAGPINIDMAQGEGAEYRHIGTDVEYELADGLKFKSLNRYTTGTHQENRIAFATADTLQNIANSLGGNARASGAFANAKNATTGNYNFMLTYPGATGASPATGATAAADPTAASTLNTNGLGVLGTVNGITINLKNFQQEFRLTQSFNEGKTSLTGGFYYSYFEVGTRQSNSQELLDVSNNYRRLDMTFLNDGTTTPIGKYTYNGITNLGSSYINSSAEKREYDWFGVLTHKIGSLSLDLGYRYLKAEVSGWGEAPQTYDGNAFVGNPGGSYPATTTAFAGAGTFVANATPAATTNGTLTFFPGLRAAVFGGGTIASASDSKGDHALTAGANYVFPDRHTAVFARFSRSPKMIYTNDVLLETPFGNGSGNGTTTPFRSQNHMKQYELGLKYSRSSVGMFLTAFKVEERNVAFADTVFLANGSLGTGPFSTLDEDVYGLELESLWSPFRGLSINLNATYQDPKFVNDVHVKGFDAAGNVIQLGVSGLMPTRIPKTYGMLGAAYTFPMTEWGTLSVNGAVQYTGRRALDQANSEFLAPFHEYSGGIGFAMKNGLTLRVDAANIANSLGITEGDPRSSTAVVANLTAPYANYRPVLPRTITASVSYRY
jgi:iron complex outermembrane receptor protein